MENVDNILTFLRTAFRNLEARKNSFADFNAIQNVYENLRYHLMKDDKEGFEFSWSHSSSLNTSAFDILIDEAFSVANATNYEEFMKAANE